MKRLKIYVSGLVQNVGYRYFTMQKARELGVKGYVMNLPNGKVLVVAEGDNATLEKFISALKEGSRAAVVKKIDISEEEWSGEFDDFKVM